MKKVSKVRQRRRAAKVPLAKFVQIMSTDSPAGTDATWLLALDENGVVWIYLGAGKGWKPLEMRRFNNAETRRDTNAFLQRNSKLTDLLDLDWP